MSPPTLATFLPLAAAAWILAAPGFAYGFSQIGSGDGSATQKEGIISVPLPPLPGQDNEPRVPPAATPTPAEPDLAPAATNPAPSAPATRPQTVPAAPASRAPATTPEPGAPTDDADVPAGMDEAPADQGSTDEGEIESTEEPAPPNDEAPADDDGGEPLVTPGADAAPSTPATATNGEGTSNAEALPPAQIFYGEEGLPRPVLDLRQKLIAIARTGDIEQLRPYLEAGEDGTVLSFGEAQEDPIAFLKSASGDGQGVEILAILLEVLQAGHTHAEAGTDAEIFVWPYFTGVPVDKLTNPQKVELFELVTAGDYQEMLGFGAYNFYRVGISPEGRLEFFVAGD